MKISVPENPKIILETLRGNGYEAFAVGGCVRDSLLGLTPHDWDVCTSALPGQIKECFADRQTLDIGIAHGTVTVIVNGQPIEVTTYRIDGDYKDNRHPESVTFTRNLREDLARRDFTVNALAYDASDGLIDVFGGVRDLQNRLIRCVGNADKRFQEDALRILRALRFASCYSFSIEEETAAAIRRNVSLLHNIAAERIAVEFTKLLCGKSAEVILNDYREVIAEFVPELRRTFDFDQKNKHHIYDVYCHITHSVGLVEATPLLRYTMLLHDIGKPQACTTDKKGSRHFKGHQMISAAIASEVLKRLRLPNHLIEPCLQLIVYHDVRYNGSVKQIRRLLNKLGEEQTRLLFQVQYADTLSQSEYLRREKLALLQTAEEQCEQILREKQCISLRQLAVSGKDLIAAGITDGKTIGSLLHRLLEMVMDEQIPNEKTALLAAALTINSDKE